MKTVLVTGGAGFIGSHLVHHLYQTYPDVRLLVLDALTYAGNVENLPNKGHNSDRFEFWYGDVRNAELVDTLISRSNMVVHLAAESHVTRSIYDNRLFFDTDVMGTQTIANAVTKFKDRIERFIHISTSEVYGTATTDTMSEDHPLSPLSPYASAKCGADRLVYSYWATYDIPAVILRPFNNFGPRQHLEKVIPRFITSCLIGEPLTVHGDGSAARDFVFVQDACELIDRVMHAQPKTVIGHTINCGTGQHHTILAIAEMIKELTGVESSIEFIGDRPGQVFRHTADASKAFNLLNWKPSRSFDEGLRTTIAWYRQNEAWWRQQMWMRKIQIVTASGNSELH